MTTTFIILGITIVLFVWGRWPADLVALLSLLALALSGVIGASDAVAGFGNPTVVMIASLFVVGEGLSRTGVTGWGGKWLLETARGSQNRLLVVVMAGTALLSAFISNTGTVATLLPAVVAAAWTVGSVPSKYLVPLAFAANTGGLLTLTGTPPNIVVAQTLEQSGLRPFSFFEYALIGAPLLITAVAYMRFIGSRILPTRSADQRPVDATADLADIASAYSLGENQYRLRVRSNSSLNGKTLREAALGPTYGAPVLRIEGRDSAPDVVLKRTTSSSCARRPRPSTGSCRSSTLACSRRPIRRRKSCRRRSVWPRSSRRHGQSTWAGRWSWERYPSASGYSC